MRDEDGYDLETEVERLRKQVTELVEVLGFYADEDHYKPKQVWTTTFPQYEPDGYKMVTPALADKGMRARAAIAKATGG